MTIQVPWKMRLRKGPTGSPSNENYWNRRKYQDDPGVPKRQALPHEEDLDHLGALHKTHH